MNTFAKLKGDLNKANQSHLLQFFDELNNGEKEAFLSQLSTIDFEKTTSLFNNAKASMEETGELLDSRMKPIPPAQFESAHGVSPSQLATYERRGLEAVANSEVAVLLMAGGQGSRLGVTYPKGLFSVGLPSSKTLFQIQAERICKVQQLAHNQTGLNGTVTWYIMTSGPTEEATAKFLSKNNYFGLSPSNVIQFEQGLLPCFDMEGRILLEDKGKVALAPDGNGGIYAALHREGILSDMEQRGIKYVHVHSVDNILVKVADPAFIGYCIQKNADCGAKVVSKNGPSEAVGVVCQVDGLFQVVEYSEITETTAKLRDTDGNLVFSAGNICNHFFTTDFLVKVAKEHLQQLKLHVAKKRIQYVNSNGEKVRPPKPNGIKIEKFVFDVFQFSDHFVTWEVPRDTEFSALKNEDSVGKDCPLTARNDLFRLHKRYIESAGAIVHGDIVEISPLLSYAGENLADVTRGKEFEAPVLLRADCEKDAITNGAQT